MNEKDCNEVEIEVYDEKKVDKKDIDITKTPWFKIVNFAVSSIAAEDPYLRAKFGAKRDASTESRVLIEDKEGEVVEVIEDEE